MDIVWNKSYSHRPIVWGAKVKPWHLVEPGFPALISPVLLTSLLKQVSVMLSWLALSVPTGKESQLCTLLAGAQTPFPPVPLLSTISATLSLAGALKQRVLGQSPAPCAWVYPYGWQHPQACSSYLYPLRKSSPALFFPTGQLLKNIPLNNPLPHSQEADYNSCSFQSWDLEPGKTVFESQVCILGQDT